MRVTVRPSSVTMKRSEYLDVRSGNVWDNAAMESFFSSLKTKRVARKTYRTRDEAKADVFDYIERFYNRKRRHAAAITGTNQKPPPCWPEDTVSPPGQARA
jgi:transposase InsO family protein